MTNEEKEIRAQFRVNRLKRKEVNQVLNDARESKKRLVEEFNTLSVKAAALGIELGKKASA